MKLCRLAKHVIGLLSFCAASAFGQTTDIVYQGELSVGGTVANGVFDLLFEPFDAETGGNSIGTPSCINDLSITGGRFTAALPYVLPTNGTPMYLEIRVRANTGLPCSNPSGFQTLAPRQRIASAPLSVFAWAIRASAPTIRGAMRLQEGTNELHIFDGLYWRVIADLDTAPLLPFESSQFFDTAGTHTFVVPSGVSRLTCVVYGGAGAGGARGPGSTSIPASCPDPRFTFAGGGGAGQQGSRGAFSLVVTPGETLTVIVGGGGSGRTNDAGASGSPSRIRRGSTDVIVAPGGQGGGCPDDEYSMPGSISGGCVADSGTPAGSAGNSSSVPTLSAPGSVISAIQGAIGSPGRSPYCWQDFVSGTNGTCPGAGGASISFSLSVPGVPSGQATNPNPGGGNGTMTTLGQSGGAGSIRVFWN